MASRYWVGGTGNWSDATNHWATASGGAPGAGNLPTASDDVFFDSASNGTGYTVTVDAGATRLCLSFTAAAPATGNLTLAGSTQLDVAANFTLYSGMVWSYTGVVRLTATSSGKTITIAGTAINSPCEIRFVGSGGVWTLQDNATVYWFNVTVGTFDINGKTVSAAVDVSSGATLTTGAATITITSNLTWSTGATINAGSLVSMSLGQGNVYNFGGHSLGGTVTINAPTGVYTIDGGNTFTNLTLTVNASKANGFNFSGNNTISGTLTITGNSILNRIIIGSSVKGTQRTLTAATVTVTNADFQDIAGAGAGSWNLSAITGGSGDCGGNSNITFTTGATQYWQHGASASYNWSDATRWFLGTNGTGGAGRVPLPQDPARFDANSFAAGSKTVVQDMPRIGGVDWTGATNSPTWTTSSTASFFGNITLISGMTLTGITQTYTYEGRGSSSITSASNVWFKQFTFDCVTGTLSLGDAFATQSIVQASGTFTTNSFSVTLTGRWVGAGTVNLGASLFLIQGSSGTGSWWTQSGGTVNPGTSIIRAQYNLTFDTAFAGGGKTYNNVEFITTGAFVNQITGSNVFNNIHIDASTEARTVQFTAGTTTTTAGMTRDGGTKLITLGSITAAQHTLVNSSVTPINMSYMSITRSTAQPAGSMWRATNSLDATVAGLNSGWDFGLSPPTIIRAK